MALLIDTIAFTPQVLEKSDDGIMRIRGVFQRAETKNANGRVYGRKLWEKLLSEKSPVRERIANRAMIGHLEHPVDGVTDLNKGAIVVTGLSLDEKNQIVGTAEVLDTIPGKSAQEYINKKVRIGVSSRGAGTVGADGTVSEDFKLETFDLVYNPSTPGAFPDKVKEDQPADKEGNRGSEPVKTGKPEKSENIISEKEEDMSNPVETLQGIEGSLRTLLEQNINGLLPYQISEIDGRLLETSVQLGALVAAKPEITGAVGSLQERINAKRKNLNELSAGRKDDQGLNKEDEVELEIPAIDEDDDDGDDEDDELISVSEFEDVLEDAEEEAARESVLEAAQEEIKDLRENLEAAEALQLSTLDRLEVVQAERTTAVELLRELSAGEKAEDVAEAIATCVEQNPHLQGVVDILAECGTPDEVFERVEAIQSTQEDEEDEEDFDLDLDEEDTEDDDKVMKKKGKEYKGMKKKGKEYSEEDMEYDDDEDEEGGSDVNKGPTTGKKGASSKGLKKKKTPKFVKKVEGKRKRNNLFEELDEVDEDLASEEDVSKGVLETTRDSELARHKGRKLVVEAIKRVGTIGN